MRLKNRVAIVTGAARGIGRTIALELAREGARVVVVDIRDELAKKVVDEINALGGKAIEIKTDVSKFEEVKLMTKAARDAFGYEAIVGLEEGLAEYMDWAGREMI